MAQVSYAPDWSRVSNKILTRPGRVLVLGRPDTGKTSFVQFLAAQGLRQGYKVGVVDLDPGQSWIGPPTTIGLGIPAQAKFDPSHLSPKSLWFIGATSPAHRSPQILAGLGELLKTAGPLDLIVFDSSGYLGPPDARRLIAQVIELVRPRHLVKLGPVEVSDVSAELHSLEPLSEVQRRSAAQRRRIRNASWQRYFKGAIRRSLPDNLIAEAIYPSQLLGLLNPAKGLSGLGICIKPAPGLEILTPVRCKITGIQPGAIAIDPRTHSELNRAELGLLRVIHDQLRLHPEIELEDLHKLLFQVVEGGAHLGRSRSALFRSLRDEWEGLSSPMPGEPLLEPIDPFNRWVRANLRPYKARGGDWVFIHRAMIASSSIKGASLSLPRLWGMLEKLAGSRFIPFDVKELKGFKPRLDQEPVHSPKYLKWSRPAYRLVARRYLSILFSG